MKKEHFFSIVLVLTLIVMATLYRENNRATPYPLDNNTTSVSAQDKKVVDGKLQNEIQVVETQQVLLEEDSPVRQENKTLKTVSGLAAYSGFGHAIEKDEEKFSQEEAAREELVADCMKNSGFEYTPAPSIVVDSAEIDNAEEFERLLAESSSDPNETYVQSLSKDKRESYYITLLGMKDPNEQEAAAHEAAAHNDSCISRAFAKIPGVYAKRNLLSEQFDQMEQRVKSDERIVVAKEKWSECMSNDGYSFSSPSDVHRHSDNTILSLSEKQENTEEAKLAQSDLVKVTQTMERCARSTKLTDTFRQVRVEYENQFVNDNKALLNQ